MLTPGELGCSGQLDHCFGYTANTGWSAQIVDLRAKVDAYVGCYFQRVFVVHCKPVAGMIIDD